MSDNAFSSLSDEALEEMIASDSDVFHLDIYNELCDRYWKSLLTERSTEEIKLYKKR